MNLSERKLNKGLGLSYLDEKTAIANIGVDTREQTPWDFDIKLPSSLLIESKTETIPYGDYTLMGFNEPHIGKPSFIIERKKSFEEFSGNIGKYWNRFEQELSGLSHFTNTYIIIEDDFHDIYAKFKNKKYKFLNISPEFFLKRISYIDITYNIKTVFLSNRYFAQKYALNLMKDFLFKYGHLNNV